MLVGHKIYSLLTTKFSKFLRVLYSLIIGILFLLIYFAEPFLQYLINDNDVFDFIKFVFMLNSFIQLFFLILIILFIGKDHGKSRINFDLLPILLVSNLLRIVAV